MDLNKKLKQIVDNVAYWNHGVVTAYSVDEGFSVNVRGREVSYVGVPFVGDPSTSPSVGESVVLGFNRNDTQRPFILGHMSPGGGGSGKKAEEAVNDDIMSWFMYGRDQGRTFGNTSMAETGLPVYDYKLPKPKDLDRLPEIGALTKDDVPIRDFTDEYKSSCFYNKKGYSINIEVIDNKNVFTIIEVDHFDESKNPRTLTLTDNSYYYNKLICKDGKRLFVYGIDPNSTNFKLISIDLTRANLLIEGSVIIEPKHDYYSKVIPNYIARMYKELYAITAPSTKNVDPPESPEIVIFTDKNIYKNNEESYPKFKVEDIPVILATKNPNDTEIVSFCSFEPSAEETYTQIPPNNNSAVTFMGNNIIVSHQIAIALTLVDKFTAYKSGPAIGYLYNYRYYQHKGYSNEVNGWNESEQTFIPSNFLNYEGGPPNEQIYVYYTAKLNNVLYNGNRLLTQGPLRLFCVTFAHVIGYNPSALSGDMLTKTESFVIDDNYYLPSLEGYNSKGYNLDLRDSNNIITISFYVWDSFKYANYIPIIYPTTFVYGQPLEFADVTPRESLTVKVPVLNPYFLQYTYKDRPLPITLLDYVWVGPMATWDDVESPYEGSVYLGIDADKTPTHWQMDYNYISKDGYGLNGFTWVGNLAYTIPSEDNREVHAIHRESIKHYKQHLVTPMGNDTHVIFTNSPDYFKFKRDYSHVMYDWEYPEKNEDYEIHHTYRGYSLQKAYSPVLRAYTINNKNKLKEAWSAQESVVEPGLAISSKLFYTKDIHVGVCDLVADLSNPVSAYKDEMVDTVIQHCFINYVPSFLKKSVLYSPLLVTNNTIITRVVEVEMDMVARDIPVSDTLCRKASTCDIKYSQTTGKYYRSSYTTYTPELVTHRYCYWYVYVTSCKSYLAAYDLTTGAKLWSTRSQHKMPEAVQVTKKSPKAGQIQDNDNDKVGVVEILNWYNEERKKIEVDQQFGTQACSDGVYVVVSALNSHPISDYYSIQNSLGIRQQTCGVVFNDPKLEDYYDNRNCCYSTWKRVPKPSRSLECFSVATGERIWSIDFSDYVVHDTETPQNRVNHQNLMGQPVIHANSVYVPIFHRLMKYNLLSGTFEGEYDLTTKKGSYASSDAESATESDIIKEFDYTINDGTVSSSKLTKYPFFRQNYIPVYNKIFYQHIAPGIADDPNESQSGNRVLNTRKEDPREDPLNIINEGE